MKCLNCGFECADGEAFCNNCGSKIGALAPSAEEPKTVFIPSQPVLSPQPENLPPQPENLPLQPQTKKKGKHRLLIILLVVGLLIIGGGAYAILDGFDIIDEPDLFSFVDSDDDKDDDKNEAFIEKDDKEETEAKTESNDPTVNVPSSENEETTVPVDKTLSEIKIGFILLHDENSTYDMNFIYAIEEMKENTGLSDENIIIKKNVPESNDCYDAATELAEWGCDIIFANSFGHEDYLIMAAKEYPDVEFCHAAGTKAHTEGLPNFHNAYAAIHEGRYLTGVAAGMKLNEMIENGEITADEAKIGFIGTFTFAEVISGYTAFYLGAKSICPQVTMDVVFTGSWFDEQLEKEAAQELIDRGCVIISQHADSLGAPTACEAAGVPNITYNGSTKAACPETYLITTRIDWTPCFEYFVTQYTEDEKIAADWCGSIENGSICVNEINYDVAAEGTIDKIEETAIEIMNGTVQVFDTSTFTVNGETLDSYMADVDSDDLFSPDTEVIFDGEFKESEFRSAPYFDLRIDGITLLNDIF